MLLLVYYWYIYVNLYENACESTRSVHQSFFLFLQGLTLLWVSFLDSIASLRLLSSISLASTTTSLSEA